MDPSVIVQRNCEESKGNNEPQGPNPNSQNWSTGPHKLYIIEILFIFPPGKAGVSKPDNRAGRKLSGPAGAEPCLRDKQEFVTTNGETKEAEVKGDVGLTNYAFRFTVLGPICGPAVAGIGWRGLLPAREEKGESREETVGKTA